MSNPVLKLENVTMQFGGVVAVDNLSMEVGEGEIVALIGPNGAGKTTAFNVVTGVYAPTNGCLYLDGRPYLCEHPTGRAKHDYLGSDVEKFAGKPTLRKTPDQITKMGLARTFQNIRLFGNLTVLRMFSLPSTCTPRAAFGGYLPSERQGGDPDAPGGDGASGDRGSGRAEG